MKTTKIIFILFACAFLGKFSIANVKGLYNNTGNTLQIQDIKPGGFILNLVNKEWEIVHEQLDEKYNGRLKIDPKACIYMDYACGYNGSNEAATLSLEKGEGGSEKILIDLFCNSDIDELTTLKTFHIQQWRTGPYLPEEIKSLNIEPIWNTCDELIVISDAEKETPKKVSSADPFTASLSFFMGLFRF